MPQNKYKYEKLGNILIRYSFVDHGFVDIYYADIYQDGIKIKELDGFSFDEVRQKALSWYRCGYLINYQFHAGGTERLLKDVLNPAVS